MNISQSFEFTKRVYYLIALVVLIMNSSTVSGAAISFSPATSTDSVAVSGGSQTSDITTESETAGSEIVIAAKNSTPATKLMDEGNSTLASIAESEQNSTNETYGEDHWVNGSSSSDQPMTDDDEADNQDCDYDDDSDIEDMESTSGDGPDLDNNIVTTMPTDLSESERSTVDSDNTGRVTSQGHHLVERSTSAQERSVCGAAGVSRALRYQSGRVTVRLLSQFQKQNVSLAAARNLSNSPDSNNFPIPDVRSGDLEEVDTPGFMAQLTDLLNDSEQLEKVLEIVKYTNEMRACFLKFYHQDCDHSVLCQGPDRKFAEVKTFCQFYQIVTDVSHEVKQLGDKLRIMVNTVTKHATSAEDIKRPVMYGRKDFIEGTVSSEEKDVQDGRVERFTNVALFRVHSFTSRCGKLADKFKGCRT